MKKLLLGKVLAALIILAVSTLFVNLQGQVTVTFPNESEVDLGNPDGIAARDAITLEFAIDATGNVSLDASTASDSLDMQALVDSWDNALAGTTDVTSAFGKTFSLLLKSPKRIQCAKGGGLGIQGRNQWRIDEAKNGELIYFELEGEVGLEFTSFAYNDMSDSLSHFVLIDNDSEHVYTVVDNQVAPDTAFTLPAGDITMRYKTDRITVTTCDTCSTGEGGKFYGWTFNVVEALPKPPAVVSTAPANADTLVAITSDYMIMFDAPMDQTTTSAAVTITPDVANRADAWSVGAEGDILTISFDDLPVSTDYSVTAGAGVTGANALTIVDADTFTFKTLPDPPTVVYTYPVVLGKQVPVNTPLAIEFSRSMIPDSVEKAISFEPELTGLGFVWNEDNSMVYMISNEMGNVIYTVTISTDATDTYGLQLSEPFTFSFNTWPVSAKDSKVSDVVLYPNPASDLMEIRGMDVASVKIYSLTGQLIRENYNSAVVNVGDIEPGSYVVTVFDRDDNRVRKLIVIE